MSRKKTQLLSNIDYRDGALQQEYAEVVHANLDNIPKRYQKAASNLHSLKPLYEQIGEDWGSPRRDIREGAFLTFLIICPLFGGTLLKSADARERHWNGWLNENSNDPRFANEGIGLISDLFEKIVIKGVFKPEKQNDPVPYVSQIIKNWKISQYREESRLIHLGDEDGKRLAEAPLESLPTQLITPSAEEAALHQISEETLYSQLGEASYLRTDKDKLLFYYIFIEERSSDAVAQILGMKAGAVREHVSTLRERFLLESDACIAQELIPMLDTVSHYEGVSFDNHPEWVVRGAEMTLEPALKTSASLASKSKAVFLPLTAGIARRPGRLFLFTGSDEEIDANLRDYLMPLGITAKDYRVNIYELRQMRTSSLPVLNKIIQRVGEHGSGLSNGDYRRIRLGLLSIGKTKEVLLTGTLHCSRGSLDGTFSDKYYRGDFDPVTLIAAQSANTWIAGHFCLFHPYFIPADTLRTAEDFWSQLTDTLSRHPKKFMEVLGSRSLYLMYAIVQSETHHAFTINVKLLDGDVIDVLKQRLTYSFLT